MPNVENEPNLGDKTLRITLTTTLSGRKTTLKDLDKAAAAAAQAIRTSLEGTYIPYAVTPIRIERFYDYEGWRAISHG